MGSPTFVYQPTERYPEHLLIYGPMGAGKTLNALSVIAASLAPGNTAHIIDCDNSFGRFERRFEGKLAVREAWEAGLGSNNMTAGMGRDGEWENETGNVIHYSVSCWEEFKWAIERAWGGAKRGDWVMVDSMTWPWQWIADWYIEQVHGTDLPDFLVAARVNAVRENKGDSGTDGAMLVEYKYVNKVWNQVIAAPLVNSRANVVLTAEAKEVRTDAFGGDKKDVRQLYERVGMKPDTQRRVGFNVDTVLYVEQKNTSKPGWRVTTVKDRERELLRGEDVGYGEDVDGVGLEKLWLKGVAGWKLTKINTDEQG